MTQNDGAKKIFTMKREIKFRGKNIVSSEWIYGSYISAKTVSGDSYHFIVPGWQRNEVKGQAVDFHKFMKSENMVHPHTVCQFTGLYDANEKEIYERDIIRFHFNGSEYILCVIFNNEVGAWCVAYKGSEYVGTRPLGELLCEYSGMEVIGNIHDNPELFKEEKQ